MPELEFRFPEAFLEVGKDDNHSYRSLKTTRRLDGRLKIDVEGWGIEEYGIFLSIETGEIFKLQIMGECATVPRRTWEKVSLSRIMEKEEEDKAGAVETVVYFPVEEGEINVRLRLYKRAC
jgi:hypothetical protein